ncbi:hypothetical protein GCM10009789_40000 [Kribbella sancticallisti]|uniref:Uncharacterized protein n=1 Tax=Kribbella sancticallisti TaxID=460087 RepID=A0ABN2DPE8_9ACTN
MQRIRSDPDRCDRGTCALVLASPLAWSWTWTVTGYTSDALALLDVVVDTARAAGDEMVAIGKDFGVANVAGFAPFITGLVQSRGGDPTSAIEHLSQARDTHDQPTTRPA